MIIQCVECIHIVLIYWIVLKAFLVTVMMIMCFNYAHHAGV